MRHRCPPGGTRGPVGLWLRWRETPIQGRIPLEPPVVALDGGRFNGPSRQEFPGVRWFEAQAHPIQTTLMETSVRPKLEPRTFPSRIADLGFRMEVPPDWISHPINAHLRDRGVGLVPNVVGVDQAGRYSSVVAGSILAKVDVPFGWHAMDDGKRLLVFEPKGQVQIHVSLIQGTGRSPDGILDEIKTQARADHPDPQFIRAENGSIRALGIRNIADGDQPLEQYHLVRGWRCAPGALPAGWAHPVRVPRGRKSDFLFQWASGSSLRRRRTPWSVP
jgi:hypothetical protein